MDRSLYGYAHAKKVPSYNILLMLLYPPAVTATTFQPPSTQQFQITAHLRAGCHVLKIEADLEKLEHDHLFILQKALLIA